MQEQIIHTILDIAEHAADINIDLYSSTFGYNVDIYFPVLNKSVYGSRDNKTMFNKKADISTRCYISGIVSERFKSDTTADNYTSEEIFMYIKRDFNIPDESKVVINLIDNQKFTFKTNKVYILTGKNNPLYKKISLVPMESIQINSVQETKDSIYNRI